MTAPLTTFMRSLNDLRRYIELLESHSELVKSIIDDDTASSSDSVSSYAANIYSFSAKRRLDYNCIIVTLYGVLEQYIESLLESYIETLVNIYPRYSLLPGELKKHHISLFIEHLQRATKTRYRGIDTINSLIAGLYSCLEDHEPYTFNSSSFTHHTMNFRVDGIDEMFRRVGLPRASRKVVRSNVFKQFLRQEPSPRRVDAGHPERCLTEIDELAERRNEVAHGVAANILSNDILLEYLNIVEHYGRALHQVVNDSTLPSIAEHKGIRLGKPIAVYNNAVVCINTKGHEIRNGDMLILKTTSTRRPYISGYISEIQVDNKGIPSVPSGTPLDIGMKISTRPKKSHTVYLIQQR